MRTLGKLKEKRATELQSELQSRLLDGETFEFAVRTNRLKPMLDSVVLTNARVIAVLQNEVKIELWADDMLRSETKKTLASWDASVVVEGRDGSSTNLGYTDNPKEVCEAIGTLIAHGLPEGIRDARAHIQQEPLPGSAVAEYFSDVALVGPLPGGGQHSTLVAYSKPDDKPSLVINAGPGGVLAAFNDRLLIAKVGALTSFLTGSLGGGRVTTFHFDQITGIEYNSGLVNGVLEVLTPSYQGTTNKDYWRGSTKGRNADSQDPFTMSN